MKSLKSLAKHTALVFAVLLSLYSCQKDDAVTLESKDSHHHEHSSTTKSVSASEIPRVMQFLESKSNERLEFVVDDTNSELGMHRSHEENLSMTTALVDQIKMVTNSYGRSNYTFKLIEEQTREGVYFLNLIVKEHKDEFYVFIIKYVPSEAWLNTFADTSSFGSYSGDIYFYDHDGVYAGRTTLVNGQTTSSDSREPCPPDIDHNSPTGGGNASATTGTASGVSSSTSSSTGTSGGSLEDLTANFGWLCNWWGELHQNPQECHNPAAGGSWTILADYGNEDRSMRDLTDCPRVSGECYQSNGDPCPNGCDEDGYCIDEQEEIESSEISIDPNIAILKFDFFKSTLNSTLLNALVTTPGLELHIQNFFYTHGYSDQTKVQAELIIKVKSIPPNGWDTSQTGNYNNNPTLSYDAIHDVPGTFGTERMYRLGNGLVLLSSQSAKAINPNQDTIVATDFPTDLAYHYIYDHSTELWYEYGLPVNEYDCLGCDIDDLFQAFIENTLVITGRYVLPVEDIIIVFTGEDFYGIEQSRAVAGAFILVDLIPGSQLVKAIKLVKYGDEVIEVSSAIIKYVDDIYKTQKQNVQNVLDGIWVFDLDEFANTVRKGNFGEMATDVDLYSKGYEPLHTRITDIDEPITQGIDHIFQNPQNGEYIIVETKYNTSTLSTTADGPQMSDDWIEGINSGIDRILNAVGGNQALADDIIDEGYISVLARVLPDGTIIYKKLNSLGQVIGNWTP